MPILECFTFPIQHPNPPPGHPPFILNPQLSLIIHGPSIFAEIGFDQILFGGAPPTSLSVPAQSPASSDPGQQVIVGPASVAAPNAAASPPVVPVMALIDTGASSSCIDDSLAQQLSLPLIDRVPVGGVHGGELLGVYLAKLSIPALGFSRAGQFVGAKMAQGNQMHRALIGRDLLAGMLMVYDGATGKVKLAF